MNTLIIAVMFVASGGMAAAELDAPPKWNQMPYAPADGAVVSVNPPPFVWVPPDDDLEYVLEVARGDVFEDMVVRQETTHVTTVSLNEPLAAGEYCWRYGVKTKDGITHSKTRCFTVSEDARVWPRPTADAMVARVPQAHPRLFVLPDEVDAYRERAASGDLEAVRAALCRQCERHLGGGLVAEPPPVRGKGAERGKNYAKIFRETRPPMNAMERCALAYLLTGDAQYGNEAKRRILHFFGWDPEGTTSYRSNDEPAMWVMMRGIRAYDWTYDLFTAEERARVEPVMRVRAAQFYDHLRNRRRFHTNPYESHAGRTIGFLGEACIAFAHEWPEARAWLDYVTTCFWNVYPAWGKDDGGWHEGPGYWSAYMSFALHFVVPLRKAAGADLMRKPFFQNTPYYLLYTNPPYARISPFGDGENGGGGGGGKGSVMFAFSSLLNDPYLRWYADESGVDIPANILGVVLSEGAPEAKAPTDLPQARYFPGVGLVSLHTRLGNAKDDVHFLMHSDPYGPISHAHPDQNAFTLEAFGEPLAIASGYYPWYGSDHHRDWQWESKSSNTITFDGGIGQVKRDARSKGRIVRFKHGDAFDYVQADATQAYQGKLTKFVRHVLHVRPGVFVILDEVAAPAPVTFEWRLHGNSDVTAQDNRMHVARGGAELEVRFLAPDALAMSEHAGAEPPPEGEYPTQYYAIAATPESAAATSYLTVLIPAEPDAPPVDVHALEVRGGLGVRVVWQGQEALAAFRTGQAPLELGGETTSGPVLAIRQKASGEPATVFKLAPPGEPHWQAGQPR